MKKMIKMFMIVSLTMIPMLGHSAETFEWRVAGGSNVFGGPKETAVGGGFEDGNPYFVCRAKLGDYMVPGKLGPHSKICFIPWNTGEKQMRTYEVLHRLQGHSVHWTRNLDNYLQTGWELPSVPYGSCSARFEGRQVVGKYTPQGGVCFIPYNGIEHEIPESQGFWVLTALPESGSELDFENIFNSELEFYGGLNS